MEHTWAVAPGTWKVAAAVDGGATVAAAEDVHGDADEGGIDSVEVCRRG